MRNRVSSGAFVKRHFATVVITGVKDAFFAPLGDSKVLAEHKGRIYRNRAVTRFQQKRVGVVGSRGPTGQAIQAGATMIAPGNISPVRNPVRSGVFRALTPGGGRRGVGVPNVEERGFRCPEGFQFGGRFTDSSYTTCGKQLFDVPSLRESLAQAVYRTRSRRRPAGGVEAGRVEGEVLTGPQADENPQLMIRRAVRVGEVGPMSSSDRENGIADAVKSIANQDETSSVLVRRDGFLMVPVVSVPELRAVPDNRNMEEAAFIQSVRSPSALGGEELGLLSNTGVTSLVYVTPNGVQIRLDRTRDLSTGERRQLGKDANTAADIDIKKDPLARLSFIVENTDGAFELSKDFGEVEDPEAEGKDGMPNWAVGAFDEAPEPRVEEAADLDEGEPAGEAGQPQQAPQQVAPRQTAERISSLKEAVEHLNKGGLLAEIDPSIVLEALKRSNVYKEQKLRDDISLFESQDGKRVIVKSENEDFEHLSAHLSSEVLRELGVQAPAVRFAGEGDDRPFFYRSPDGVVEGAEVTNDFDSSEVPPEQVLGVQIADWLTDTRDRTKASLFKSTSGEDVELVASVGPMSAAVGLSEDELNARREAVLQDFFSSTTELYGRRFTDSSEEEKQIVVEILDSLIARAQEFSWGDYLEQLNIDGKLSEAEQQHLEIVRAIFQTRLDALVKQRDVVLQTIGA